VHGFQIELEAVMSIPPLLSSSPPPLEENGSVLDHDDDFGDFCDYASVRTVASTLSITENASAFQPVESSGGLYLDSSNLQPDNVEEIDEWSDYDSVVVQPPLQADCDVSFSDQVSVVDGSLSHVACVGEIPAACSSHDSSSDLPAESPSASQTITAEALYSEDVSCGCVAREEVECHDESLHSSEQKADSVCDNVNTDVNQECSLDDVTHPIVVDEGSLSVDSNHCIEFNNDVDLVVQESDNDSFNELSHDTEISCGNEHAFADDDQPVLGEIDFVHNFPSLSSDREPPESDEAHLGVYNSDDAASASGEDREDSARIESSTEITPHSVCPPPVNVSFEADLTCSTMNGSETLVKQQDETLSADHHSTCQQTLASSEEVDDDFDDFEEFVAAKQGPVDDQPIADSSTYQWNAFESTADESDDWAVFQHSDPPLSSDPSTDVTATAGHVQQMAVACSDQLSKVRNI